MKKLWNSFKIAFSMYSKIPMPQSEWTEENMSYAMIFFPLVGCVIAALEYVTFKGKLYVSGFGIRGADLFFAIFMALIPIFVTGGIHMDGFMDTKDALASYQPKEKRLEILKDPHAGAFAIISCVVYFLIDVAIFSLVTEENIYAIMLTFVISRILSGLSVVSFGKAKTDGLAHTFAKNASKNITKYVLCVFLAISEGLLVIVGGPGGMAAAITSMLVFTYYRGMAKNYFGGITGDLAGYFLQMCEIWMAFFIVVVCVVFHILGVVM